MISWIKDKKHINYITTSLNNKLKKDNIVKQVKEVISSNDVYHTAWIKSLLTIIEYSITDNSKLAFIHLDNTIHTEHILPIGWNEFDDWKNKFSENDINRYLHSFGNLTLLSGSKNISASNNPYKVKVNIYKGKGKYSENDTGITAFDMTKKIIVDYPFEWNVASIENRKRWLESKFFEIMDI